MTAKEIKTLNWWIAEHVFGCTPDPEQCGWVKQVRADGKTYNFELPDYTSPAGAMELLKKCIIKDAYSTGSMIRGASEEFGTLETQICLFAKKLYEV